MGGRTPRLMPFHALGGVCMVGHDRVDAGAVGVTQNALLETA